MSGNQTFSLAGEITIYRAAELRQFLAEATQAGLDGQAIDIDLSGVTEIDCAGVQLLIAARRTMQAGGRNLQLVNHAPAVIDALEMMGLLGYFGDAVVSPAAIDAGAEQAH